MLLALVIPELEKIFSLKEEQRKAMMAFLDGKRVFATRPTGLIFEFDIIWFVDPTG